MLIEPDIFVLYFILTEFLIRAVPNWQKLVFGRLRITGAIKLSLRKLQHSRFSASRHVHYSECYQLS